MGALCDGCECPKWCKCGQCTCDRRVRYRNKLIQFSRDRLELEDIEELIMTTLFDEEELYQLYKRFQKLDKSGRGLLTNTEFLELEEFIVNPFRERLMAAFPLRSEKQLQDDMKVNRNLNVRGGARRLNFIQVDREEEIMEEYEEDDDDKSISIISKPPGSAKPLKKRTEENSDQDDDPEGSSEGFKKMDKDKISEINDSEEGDDRSIFSPKAKVIHKKMRTMVKRVKEIAYIDFKEFARYLSLLNPAASQDSRIKFAFRLFDINGDGKIDINDLLSSMDMLYGEKISENKKTQMADSILEESDQGGKEYLDVDDFKKIFWANPDISTRFQIFLIV